MLLLLLLLQLLLLLHLLLRLLLGLLCGVQVEHLVADVLENVETEVLHELIPPVLLVLLLFSGRRLVDPVGDLELGQLAGQVHERDGDDLRLPLEAQRGAVAVVDERPRHLHHDANLLAVALERLGVLEQVAVRVLALQVELDRLEQDALVDHDLLDHLLLAATTTSRTETETMSVRWVACERELELLRLQVGPGLGDQVFALLGRLFDLAGEEEATGGHDEARKLAKRVEHVEAVEEDDARRHRVVASYNGKAKNTNKEKSGLECWLSGN